MPDCRRRRTEQTMYDIHCHICYGSDDGAESLETAVEMIALAAENGTTGMAATPHCNVPGSYRNYWDAGLHQKIKTLRTALQARGIGVTIFAGQEIFCTEETPRLLAQGTLITLNQSRYPLVEFHFYEEADSVFQKVQRLIAAGYTPVIAHPERYAFISEDPDAADKLKKLGCLLQLNKGSLMGRFGDAAFRASRRIMADRLADVVASDAHSPYVRTPNLRRVHELICEEYAYDYADLLLEENPRRILENRDTLG